MVSLINKIVLVMLFPLILVGCMEGGSPTISEGEDDGRLQILATTTIVGDVVKEIGGEQVDVEVLLPLGIDPHNYQPTPQDISKAVDADIIFMNGAGLEGFVRTLIENTSGVGQIVDLSNGVSLIALDSVDDDAEEANDIGSDPHIWTDPNNVKIWTENISQALIRADASHAEYYQENAQNYSQKLDSLDKWIYEQVMLVPQERRKLLFDHHVFGYYTKRYGFDVIGAIIPSFSTLAEPTAQEIAEIEDKINSLGVPAIFIGSVANANIADQITQDTGVKIVRLYTDSLSGDSGEASNYIDYLKFNTNAIVEALK